MVKFDQNLCEICDMNSTLGSDVPLAMFAFCFASGPMDASQEGQIYNNRIICCVISLKHSMEQNTSTAYFKKLWQIPEKFETHGHVAGSDSLGALSLKFDSPNSISFTSVRKFDFLKKPLIPDFELLDS